MSTNQAMGSAARVKESLAKEPVLWVVVPCYNEEAVILETAPLFKSQIDHLISEGLVSNQSRILYVDDGSTDRTWKLIRDLNASDPAFQGISLSRNRGHQNALLAGLMVAKDRCDASISIDCDGQDDVTAMEGMVRAYLDGSDVVYGVRSDRSSDTGFKRKSAEAFYSLMGKLGAETVPNHADYRLMSARALSALGEYGEVNLYLRGMVPLIGFRSATVEYARHERLAGESHYPLGKMLHLGMDGITSLSVKPLRFVSGLGIVVGLIGLLGLVWALVSFLLGQVVSGWTSTICVIALLGGVQLIGLGIVGEYIGKIYLETKGRPRYIVSEDTFGRSVE